MSKSLEGEIARIIRSQGLVVWFRGLEFRGLGFTGFNLGVLGLGLYLGFRILGSTV